MHFLLDTRCQGILRLNPFRFEVRTTENFRDRPCNCVNSFGSAAAKAEKTQILVEKGLGSMAPSYLKYDRVLF